MEVTINKVVKEDSVSVTVDNPRADLIYIDSEYGRQRNFKVYPYSQLNDSILSSYMDYYDKYKKIVSSYYPELTLGFSRS